jgi:hypothetical protein
MRKGSPDEAARYRIARGRVLLREPVETPAPAPAPDNEKKGSFNSSPLPPGEGSGVREQTLVLHPWSLLIASAVIAQPEDDKEEKARRLRLEKVIEDANELIKSQQKLLQGKGYLLRGKAKSELGNRTEGLKEYAKGLSLIAKDAKIEADEIAALIEQIERHPAFLRKDPLEYNPIMAEKHFGEGLHFFWDKKYVEAEAQFQTALRYYEKDARFEYFLGLSQYLQKSKNKQEYRDKQAAANHSFEQGAMKEAKAAANNPDTVREINVSLERIQGELRQLINSYRYKATNPDPDAKEKEK